MKNEIIYLELADDSIYKSSEICEKLTSKFPELGNEIILPISQENREENVPIFIFSQNDDFKIQGNFNTITVMVRNIDKEKLFDIIKYIFNIFENKCNIRAIACTFEEKLDINKLKSFKEKHITNINTIDTDKIHFTLLREIEVYGKKTRCLEGYSNINNDFVVHFEFNMRLNDFKKIDFKYFTKFYNYIEEYKEGRKSCLL